MHLKRLVVAAVVIPLAYLYVSFLSPVFFLVLLMAVASIAQIEFYRLSKTPKTLSAIGIAWGTLMLGLPLIGSLQNIPEHHLYLYRYFSLIFVCSFMLLTTIRLLLKRNPSASIHHISTTVAGVLYIPALMLPQWHLRLTGYEWIVILYGMVWAADSCAYYVGKGIGRRRLYIEISPNKTVEGAAGSVIGATVAAVLLGAVMVPDAGMLFLIFTGAAIGIVSIAGDLVESMFKRDAGIKDSSSFIPGHGGLLDKIDSVLFAGPVLYVITLLR